MSRKLYELKSFFWGTTKVSLLHRFGAKVIDTLFLVTGMLVMKPFCGPFWTFLVISILGSLMDGLGAGQSFGKKMMGLQVVQDIQKTPCEWYASFVRNIPWSLAIACCMTPALLWVGVLLGLWCCFEAWLCLTFETQIRIGEVLSNTCVEELQFID